MDKNGIQSLINQVFKTWTPARVEVRDVFTNSIRLLIISDRFMGLNLEERLALVKAQIRMEEPDLASKFLWSVQPYTFAEAGGIFSPEDEEFSDEKKDKHRKAAMPEIDSQ